MDFTFRPIDAWPGDLRTDSSRQRSPFTAKYPDTLALLRRELSHLKAEGVVIQLALQERDIRVSDGLPKAASRPTHPGVILAFESKHGPLKYFTDVYMNGWNTTHQGWQANLRAVGLGLEALRKVDRYGITKRGEQYTGWKELGSGAVPMGAGMNGEKAIEILRFHTGPCDFTNPYAVKAAFRTIAKVLHPDVGGDAETFMQVKGAADYLIEKYS